MMKRFRVQMLPRSSRACAVNQSVLRLQIESRLINRSAKFDEPMANPTFHRAERRASTNGHIGMGTRSTAGSITLATSARDNMLDWLTSGSM